MKISINWLKDYLDFNRTPEQLADDLSLFGHEVESINQVDGDTVLDLEITPNRGDCLSHLGIARELAALYNIKIKNQKSKIKIKENLIDKKIAVEIDDSKICPRFSARIIDNIAIKPSNEMIQKRLKSVGFRPINNIVDITNYVMLATGQPLHAFDYDKIKDGLMRVRLAQNNEKLTTLDGKSHILPEKAIIIEDEEKIYDLAGIMGGQNSEVDENTKTIVLQGAIFDPRLIRQASKVLNHQTDASYRYERGVDIEGTTIGVDLASSLIQESCPEAQISGLIDIYPEHLKTVEIPFKIEDINRLLGTVISLEQAKERLERLGIKVESELAIPPSYRQDITIWQDLAEEVARIEGYNKLRIKNDELRIKNNQKLISENYHQIERLKDYLVEAGLTEVYSYSFVDKRTLSAIGTKIDDCVEVANPLSPETQFMRPSLLPTILAQIAKNPWAPDVQMFEIGKIFSKDNEQTELVIASTTKTDFDLKPVDQRHLDFFKIRRKVFARVWPLKEFIAKIKLPNKIQTKISTAKYRPVPQFPPVVRDLAFVVDEKITADEVNMVIQSVDPKVFLVELFDEFSSPKLGENKKNLAYHVWFQDINRTMEDKDVETIIQEIVKAVSEKFRAQLRNY